MTRITSKQIGKAIEAAGFVAGVEVFIDRQAHCCHFYNDVTPLDSFVEATVYVPRLNDLTLEQWVEIFQDKYVDVE